MKILAATDGSKHGQWAIEWLARLPFKTQSRVRVIHVVDVSSLRAPFMFQPVVLGTERYLREEVRRMERAAEAIKQKSSQLLKTLQLPGTIAVDRGAVGPTIIKHAKRGVALLSIGSRGPDALDKFMLGSVSNFAIHHATCSVLVVKQAPRPVKRIVLAIDGSLASKKAARFLCRTFKPTSNSSTQNQVSVIIVHVIPHRDYPEAATMVVKQCADMMSKYGFALRTMTQVGRPAVEILKIANDRKADLIVTGAKGLGAIRRMLLGSVSTRIMQHSACSVLVIK